MMSWIKRVFWTIKRGRKRISARATKKRYPTIPGWKIIGLVLVLLLAGGMTGRAFAQEKMPDPKVFAETFLGTKTCSPFSVAVTGLDTSASAANDTYAISAYYLVDNSDLMFVPYAMVLSNEYTETGTWLYFDWNRDGVVDQATLFEELSDDDTDICLTAAKVVTDQ